MTSFNSRTVCVLICFVLSYCQISITILQGVLFSVINCVSVQAGSSNIKWNYFNDDKGKKLYFLCLSACYVLRLIWMLQVLPGYVGTAESSYRISSLIYVPLFLITIASAIVVRKWLQCQWSFLNRLDYWLLIHFVHFLSFILLLSICWNVYIM